MYNKYARVRHYPYSKFFGCIGQSKHAVTLSTVEDNTYYNKPNKSNKSNLHTYNCMLYNNVFVVCILLAHKNVYILLSVKLNVNILSGSLSEL